MQTTVTPLREPDLERVPQPPANIEAEQALLGAILVNNTAHSRVAEFLMPAKRRASAAAAASGSSL